MAFVLMSSAFAGGGSIPAKYTCSGDDVSPPLAWTGAPESTRSFALIVDDPDAPDPKAPKRTWVHWVLYNIPPAVKSIPEGASLEGISREVLTGLNDWGRNDYGGPCPPIGRHRYFHKLYALDTVLPDLRHPTKKQLESAMGGHILAQADLMGTYQK